MRSLFLSILAFFTVTATFFALNNISQIPWEVMQYLWYAWLPCSAAAIAFCYGLWANRSGGSIFMVAFLIVPVILLSHKYQLPFSTAISFPPSIILALLFSLPLEIIGKKMRKAHKKNTRQN